MPGLEDRLALLRQLIAAQASGAQDAMAPPRAQPSYRDLQKQMADLMGPQSQPQAPASQPPMPSSPQPSAYGPFQAGSYGDMQSRVSSGNIPDTNRFSDLQNKMGDFRGYGNTDPRMDNTPPSPETPAPPTSIGPPSIDRPLTGTSYSPPAQPEQKSKMDDFLQRVMGEERRNNSMANIEEGLNKIQVPTAGEIRLGIKQQPQEPSRYRNLMPMTLRQRLTDQGLPTGQTYEQTKMLAPLAGIAGREENQNESNKLKIAQQFQTATKELRGIKERIPMARELANQQTWTSDLLSYISTLRASGLNRLNQVELNNIIKPQGIIQKLSNWASLKAGNTIDPAQRQDLLRTLDTIEKATDASLARAAHEYGGLNPKAMSEDQLRAFGGADEQTGGGTVTLYQPSGAPVQIPKENAQEALKRGLLQAPPR